MKERPISLSVALESTRNQASWLERRDLTASLHSYSPPRRISDTAILVHDNCIKLWKAYISSILKQDEIFSLHGLFGPSPIIVWELFPFIIPCPVF